MCKRVIFSFFILVCSQVSIAKIVLPKIFGDNMVLQQNSSVCIWGWAGKGEIITINASWAGCASSKAIVDANGKWQTRVKTPVAGGPYRLDVACGQDMVHFKNVMAGEVWLCSGQSNMRMPLEGWLSQNQPIRNSARAIAQANYPDMRLFGMNSYTAEQPVWDCNGQWQVCMPATVKDFSAVAYFFGRDLQKKLNVPVGLILAAWGATPAEAWTSRETLQNDPDLKAILARAYQSDVPPQRRPCYIYNGMINPIARYGIRGATWYQGESNVERAYEYRRLFQGLIKNWRGVWEEKDFPFLFVQLANYGPVLSTPGESDWAELREAQNVALSGPNTGMAVTIDIGDSNSIHPENKQDVGKRLALWALAKTYDRNIEYSGPMYKSMSVRGNKIILYFDHVYGGLVAGNSDKLHGFAIAGADKEFTWADATIQGETVIVYSAEVPEPVAVRYAWAKNPICNLRNKSGLPASPFRTDNWPLTTQKSFNPE
ncbi:MAG: hypothetical protein A2Y12_04845 [Planctomycetes bacterium GWF2_42_9]|nr:MAG: hypothetical protein A2Y12_04845 [Planctomycetes bacterium GWF2_42_9]